MPRRALLITGLVAVLAGLAVGFLAVAIALDHNPQQEFVAADGAWRLEPVLSLFAAGVIEAGAVVFGLGCGVMLAIKALTRR